MKLERTLRNIGRAFLTGVFCIGLSGCPTTVITVPENIGVTIDTAQTGMIKGKAVLPKVENNQINWYGVKGVEVEVRGTTFKTTTVSGGFYAIDNIPSGSYNVLGKYFSGGYLPDYVSEDEPAIVLRQQLTEVPDLKLIPSYLILDRILYGKVYTSHDKIYPFVGELRMRKWYGNDLLGTVTTSLDGFYAFQGDMHFVFLTAGIEGKKVRFFNEPSDMDYASVSGMKQLDAFLVNN